MSQFACDMFVDESGRWKTIVADSTLQFSECCGRSAGWPRGGGWRWGGCVFVEHKLQAADAHEFPFVAAAPVNAVAGCFNGALEYEQAAFGRAVFVQIFHDFFCNVVADAGDEYVCSRFDEPEFHAPAHGGWEVIGDNDEHWLLQ